MKGSVAKWGNSLALRLPKGLADEANLEEGADVEMRVEGGKLIVTAACRRLSLDELLEGVTPENLHDEVDWGNPAGREVW